MPSMYLVAPGPSYFPAQNSNTQLMQIHADGVLAYAPFLAS